MNRKQQIPEAVIKSIFAALLDELETKPSEQQQATIYRRALNHCFTVDQTYQYIYDTIEDLFIQDEMLTLDDYATFNRLFRIDTLAQGHTTWKFSLSGATHVDEAVTGSEYGIQLTLHQQDESSPYQLYSDIEDSPNEMVRRFVLLAKQFNFDLELFRDHFDSVKHTRPQIIPRHIVASLFDMACREHAEEHLTVGHRADIVDDIMTKQPVDLEEANDFITDFFFPVNK